MKKDNKFFVGGLIFSAIIISGSLVFLGMQIAGSSKADVTAADIEKGLEEFAAKQRGDTPKEEQAPVLEGDYADDDAFLGDGDSEVVLVEFSDFQCPYCRKFFNETFPQIKENYIDTNKIKFVYRDFPLNFHEGAYPAALASECVREQEGDDAFFAMHDLIFEGQNALGGGTVEIPDESLISYAEEIGVDMQEFNECFENDRFEAEIYADMAEGQKIGIRGTPGFVINGETISGAQPYYVFETAIENALSAQ